MEKVNNSNDWVTKSFWKSRGFQFLTFNKIEGEPNLELSVHRVLTILFDDRAP